MHGEEKLKKVISMQYYRTSQRVYRSGTNDQLSLSLCFNHTHHTLLWLLRFLEDCVHQEVIQEDQRVGAFHLQGGDHVQSPLPLTHHRLQHLIGGQLLLKDQALTFSLTVSIFVKLTIFFYTLELNIRHYDM